MTISEVSDNKHKTLVLFDGDCVLCNFWVTLIKRNRNANTFQCMSLQSWTNSGSNDLESNNSTLKISDSVNSNTNALKLNANIQQSITQLPDSVIVIKNNQVYIESDAVLEVLKQLSGPMKMLLIGYCIPKGIRNRLYRWVAKNRYRWFGKTDTCSL